MKELRQLAVGMAVDAVAIGLFCCTVLVWAAILARPL